MLTLVRAARARARPAIVAALITSSLVDISLRVAEIVFKRRRVRPFNDTRSQPHTHPPRAPVQRFPIHSHRRIFHFKVCHRSLFSPQRRVELVRLQHLPGNDRILLGSRKQTISPRDRDIVRGRARARLYLTESSSRKFNLFIAESSSRYFVSRTLCAWNTRRSESRYESFQRCWTRIGEGVFDVSFPSYRSTRFLFFLNGRVANESESKIKRTNVVLVSIPLFASTDRDRSPIVFSAI